MLITAATGASMSAHAAGKLTLRSSGGGRISVPSATLGGTETPGTITGYLNSGQYCPILKWGPSVTFNQLEGFEGLKLVWIRVGTGYIYHKTLDCPYVKNSSFYVPTFDKFAIEAKAEGCKLCCSEV